MGENPYLIEMQLLDSLQPGDVSVLACNGPTDTYRALGRIAHHRFDHQRGAGRLHHRRLDPRRSPVSEALNFPVFHGGIGPLDTRGRAYMTEMDTDVICGGVWVRSGDIVFADIDGVVVIPREDEKEIIERAREDYKRKPYTRRASPRAAAARGL